MKNIILFMLVVLVLLIGCGQQQGLKEPTKIESHTGTEGLVMNLLKSYPPDEISKGSEFLIGLEIMNKGAYKIEDGSIIMGGYNPDYIYLENRQALFNLEGKSIEHPEGDYGILYFKVKDIGIPEGHLEYPVAFTIQAFYDYKTEATADVCINPNIYEYAKTEEKGCEIKEIKLTDGQGAPVEVTKIEETISAQAIESDLEVQFKIYIANKGNGKVIEKVHVDEVILSNRRMSCSPDAIEFEQGEEKAFLCKMMIERTSSPYSAPLIMRLSYEYTQRLDKNIKVVSLI